MTVNRSLRYLNFFYFLAILLLLFCYLSLPVCVCVCVCTYVNKTTPENTKHTRFPPGPVWWAGNRHSGRTSKKIFLYQNSRHPIHVRCSIVHMHFVRLLNSENVRTSLTADAGWHSRRFSQAT